MLQGFHQFCEKLVLFFDRIGLYTWSWSRRRWRAPSEVLEHADVVDDHARALARRATVRSRDGLHERVVLHRLVEIDGAAGRHVEAGDPHGADEHEPQRVVGVLELALEVLLLHPLAVRQDVEALLLQVVDLVLRLADHHRHVHGAHPVEPLGETGSRLFGALCELRLLALGQLSRPVPCDLVVHAHGRRLVDGDEHRLAEITSRREVAHEVCCDLRPAGRRG